MLLGCERGGDIAQDIGEAIEDECSWGRRAVERSEAIVQERRYELIQ